MWKLRSDERLVRWRDFRNSLSGLSLEQALQSTQEFWRSAPFSPYYLDAEQPLTWPDPWQLITENYYCDIAKALGIIYTIALSDHGKNLDIALSIYQDPATRHTYNLAIFDQGKYVINLFADEIVNKASINKSFKLIFNYTSTDLRLQEY